MSKTISTIIKAGFITVGLMGAVTLNAWWCEHCKRDHISQRCPITGNTKNGPILPHVRIVGRTPDDHTVVQHDGDLVMYTCRDNEEIEVRNIGDRLLYYESGIIDDGLGGFYDKHGEPLQPIGQLADGNSIYPQPLDIEDPDNVLEKLRFFALIDNKPQSVYQLKNGRFVYVSFNSRGVYSPTPYRYFDGQEYVDWDGNVEPPHPFESYDC
ncbi:MAG: hypothetical protein LBJ78_04420 [Puniceicoccales bacterium]|nr:hypothetical protein [Puniceicoccales bacterium]